MEDFGEPAAFPLARAPAPRRRGRWRFRRGSLVLALAFTLGAGAFLGAALGVSQAQAAPTALGGAAARQMPTVGPGTPGACEGELTVSHVGDRTITVTRTDGSTATIHVTSRTHYTRSGQAVAASAVVVGSKIYVVGACTGQGRTINATSIEIVG